MSTQIMMENNNIVKPGKKVNFLRRLVQNIATKRSGRRSESRKEKCDKAVQMVEDHDRANLLETVRNSLIGKDVMISTPYGNRKMVYADCTASGRAVSFIEDFIRREVLPTYGNTHTATSLAGAQTTRYREEARSLVGKAVNASEEDVVLFVGSGSTAAINLLSKMIFRTNSRENQHKAVVFVGPFEHHSNLLPWKEAGAKVVFIREDAHGRYGIDPEHLEQELKEHSDYPLKIGTFSAASNLTGIVTDTRKVTALLKSHGALSFWDYAAGAPYLPMDMNPVSNGLLQKDAIFLSTHKLIGGPGSCGCLIVKKSVLSRFIALDKHHLLPPVNPGGGTVTFVSEKGHAYYESFHEREESGTPDIIGSIRTGLTFQLRSALGIDFIHSLERQIASKVFTRLSQNKHIEMYGNPAIPFENRLPTVVFNIKYPDSSLYLHHGFVCALLNDLFGIQVRGGCGCAGPYGTYLLGIKEDSLIGKYQQVVVEEKMEIYKPGFVRVSFNYIMTNEEIDYICTAIELIAESGWKLLPVYRFNNLGDWVHSSDCSAQERSLFDISYSPSGAFKCRSPRQDLKDKKSTTVLRTYLAEAKSIMAKPARSPSYDASLSDEKILTDSSSEVALSIRWFVLPSECLKDLS